MEDILCHFIPVSETCHSIYFVVLLTEHYAAPESDSIILYTPYTKISVPPGQSVDYSISLINNSREVINVDLSLKGLPGQWNYSLKAGGYNIRQLSVLPGQKETINLRVDVPLKVNKGSCHFQVTAGTLICAATYNNCIRTGGL